ncbi:sulfatase [Polaribacter sp. SA4-10]|uniref:alkaline phosphatase family protein n=1 Tax=Polaribacter sp. SA4-10 TaxID=754397 RepID=UPI000B3C85A5|nr:alkaline phosphatase family protein [Polaribacter sp. SA4-10]ARV07843.1 sulfatase [Polaribacter sp. SA4-10]
MKLKFLNNKFFIYILLTLSLILSFWVISLFEIISTIYSGKEIATIFTYILFKFLNQFFAGVLIALICFPLYLIFNYFNKKIGIIFIKIFFALLVLVEFSLTKYSLTTLLNLGADLLGYSMYDIYLTVTSSESISFVYFIAFFIFPLLFLMIFYFIRKKSIHKFIAIGLLVLITFTISLKLFYTDISEAIYQNKTYFFVADVLNYKMNKTEINASNFIGNNEYPLLKSSKETKDVLSPFFNLNNEKPNIVFIIVEGLGAEFMGDKYYGGFTPYLDSLMPKSLHWENFLSNTGRTFGALPSLLGSLPFGEKGFLEIPETPAHISLLSILKMNGYTTSFYSGDRSSFDKKINFLEYNNVDNIIDENLYDDSYPKTVNEATGFSWGYSDNEIFTKTLSVLDDRKTPRLDIITTQTIHEPFNFPSKDLFLLKVDSTLNAGKKFKMTEKEITANKDIFASILYADHSLKKFMKAFEKRDDFNNTVFVITGDHRLIPITQKDKLCRFNVSLFIYSPMLNKTASIKSISSHLDITPSVLSLLAANFSVKIPEKTSWLGTGLDTVKEFSNVHEIPLMRYKGSVIDYIYKEYMYSGGDLFKINKNFGLNKIDDQILLDEISQSFEKFKELNAYVTQNDKIYPKDATLVSVNKHEFTSKEKATIASLSTNLTLDQVFLLAREKAFNKQRETARLLCNYILSKEPNYIDVKVLKGRTFAWDGKYIESEEELLNALKRAPYYDDIYLALLDMYWWSFQSEKAELIFEKAKKNNIKNDEVAYKMARASLLMEDEMKANSLIDSILLKNPTNKEYIKLKNSLK